jgi:restriction system protein
MVRGDKYGQFQEMALEKGFSYIGFFEVADLIQATTKEAVFDLCRQAYPDAAEASLRNFGKQSFSFAHRIQKDDLVAMPLRSRPQIAIGRVTGKYKYRNDLGDIRHTRPVDWLRTDIPRTVFGQDLLYSLGAFMTVCQIQRNNAESRVRAIIKDNKDPGFSGQDEQAEGDESHEFQSNVELLARDEILKHFEKHFKGHNLARLVDAVLCAEGYQTQLSQPGPDGGVDILAGQGLLGFDKPRLCVQVKSSSSPADVTTLRTLQGSMANFKAEQGLLVSWGGFNIAAEKEARLSFFSVRLWNAEDLIEAVLKNYDKLPEEIQSELPLKRIWALVLEE